MSFSYSGNPDHSPVDGVRFLIGDTDQCDVLLQDEEIQSFLRLYNQTPLNAAIRCCETIIAKLSRRPDEQVGQVRISYSQQAKAYRALLSDLQNRIATENAAPYAGGISISDQNAQNQNPDRVRPKFNRNIFNNREDSPFVDGAPFSVDGGFLE